MIPAYLIIDPVGTYQTHQPNWPIPGLPNARQASTNNTDYFTITAPRLNHPDLPTTLQLLGVDAITLLNTTEPEGHQTVLGRCAHVTHGNPDTIINNQPGPHLTQDCPTHLPAPEYPRLDTGGRNLILILLRGETIQEGLTDYATDAFTSHGINIVTSRTLIPTPAQLKALYDTPRTRAWLAGNIRTHWGLPVKAICGQGDQDVYERALQIKTQLRQTLAKDRRRNGVHTSDSLQAATRELAAFFAQEQTQP